jgi:uncharacterized oxidoreductase
METMWLNRNSDGKSTALVTGGSVGLGLAIARELVARDFDVFICARTEADLKRATEIEPALRAIQADVASAADRERLMRTIGEQTGGRALDCLINNAAIVRAHDYLNPFTLKTDRARAELEINFAAPIELIRLYLAGRLGVTDGPAAIVNIGTPGALFPLEANPLYSATKAGLHMFTQALRRQLADSPIKVIEVFPPSLDTRLADQLDVASQAANGQDAIDEVARATVAGILDGTEVVLGHPQSRQLYEMIPQLDPAFVDQINAGVKRRKGWDSEELS